jgi:2-keto-3-deoxy-L-rhamnonate aldolase RhmA
MIRPTLLAGLALAATAPLAQSQARINPVVELLEQKKAVFGLYAPANPRQRPGAAPTVTPQAMKTPAQLAVDALGVPTSDYIFDGTMERNFERSYPAFVEFANGMFGNGMMQKARMKAPLFVKTPEIAPDPAVARERIRQQLNAGVSGIVFVDVKSADEVRQGLAMMRFASKGGTRTDDVGDAAKLWGLSDKDYRDKADLWPLNPKGELVNFTIIESLEGLKNVREIAAVKGIGVLFPGAGTLRGIFSTVDSSVTPPRRVLDEPKWEASIQQVLAACKEFNVPCGYPANANDIEMRMKQGFSVFIIGWGDQGVRAVEIGRGVAGR